MAEEYEKSEGYGRRPLWQWILIYIIIGAVVYFLIYYFVIAKRNVSPSGSGGTTPKQDTQPNNPGY